MNGTTSAHKKQSKILDYKGGVQTGLRGHSISSSSILDLQHGRGISDSNKSTQGSPLQLSSYTRASCSTSKNRKLKVHAHLEWASKTWYSTMPFHEIFFVVFCHAVARHDFRPSPIRETPAIANLCPEGTCELSYLPFHPARGRTCPTLHHFAPILCVDATNPAIK